MFKREVDGDEIEFALGEKAWKEIRGRHPDFIEWLCDRAPQMAEACSRLMGAPPGVTDIEGMMLLTILRQKYLDSRKYDAEQSERDEVAEQLMEEPDTYEAPV